MNDTPAPDSSNQPAAPEAARTATVRVLAQFVRDLSFENPGLLNGNGGTAPEIELGIDVRVEPAGQPQESAFMVELRLSAKAKRGEAVVFIVEMIYAGAFQVQGASREEIEPILLIECPRLLFPFARRIIADVTREGGHPPLMIDPIDFVGLYRQQRAQAAQGQQPQA
jgi:preprotein translocase subunit SecB